MDSIFIEDLRIDALIGVYAWEREIRQSLLFGVTLGYDNHKPADSGALADTMDYASVVAVLRAHVAGRTDALLETLAESCCSMLAERFQPKLIELRINKPLAALNLGCARVGVCLQRRYD
ncbi:MAG: dihydroneopterin aldolase [Rhodanobacter sp.]